MNERLSTLWLLYKNNVAEGVQLSMRDFGFDVGPKTIFGFAPSVSNQSKQTEILKALQDIWASNRCLPREAGFEEDMDDEKKLVELGLQMIEVAKSQDIATFDLLLESGYPVNFQHPKHLSTVLHVLCTKKAPISQEMIRRLLDLDELDLLIEDSLGRLPLNNALLFHRTSQELLQEIRDKTMKQLDDQSIGRDEFNREQAQKLAEWMTHSWYQDIDRVNSLYYGIE